MDAGNHGRFVTTSVGPGTIGAGMWYRKRETIDELAAAKNFSAKLATRPALWQPVVSGRRSKLRMGVAAV